MVVEGHKAVDHLVFEMDVDGRQRFIVDDLRDGEVVRRGEADGAGGGQCPKNCLRADAAVVRVGAVEDFVEQEEGGAGLR